MLAKVSKNVLLLATLISLVCGKPYDGFKIFDMRPRTSKDLHVLETLFNRNESLYDFFGKPMLKRSSKIMVHPESVPHFLNLVSKHSIDFRMVNENFGETLDREMKTHHKLKELKPFREGERLGTERYYTHDEMNSYMTDLGNRYPHRVFVKTMGKSYEGRLIKAITITNGDGRVGKKVILIDGGIHAREWIAPAAAIYLIGELVENFEENSSLLLDYDWVILPLVNPDGYEYSQISSETRMWRKSRQPYSYRELTCYGVDLNRNFGYHWNGPGASPQPCDGIYAGPKAFSEPESIILRDLMHTHRDRGIMYITFHSFGGYLLYPWGYKAVLADNWKDLEEVGKAGADAILEATGYEYTVGSSGTIYYVAAGASDDYAYSIGYPQVFTMELREGGDEYFNPPPSEIDLIVKETWAGVRSMARKAIEKYADH